MSGAPDLSGASPWPVAVLTGFLGSGKTTLLRRLLRAPGMADTLVVMNEWGEIGLDHQLIEWADERIVLLPGGCLCCTVRQDLARTLADVVRGWAAGALPDFGRVVIETSGLAEPDGVAATLLTHPLLHGRFALACLTALVDGEQGQNILDRHATARRQAAAADRLLLTKADRADAGAIAALGARLAGLNPLAPIEAVTFGAIAPARLFTAPPAGTRARRCETVVAHPDAAIASRSLTAAAPLRWPALQAWLARRLERADLRLLRLKGILDLAGQARPVVLQAVGTAFQPLETLEAWPRGPRRSVLVLIAEGTLPDSLAETFAACA